MSGALFVNLSRFPFIRREPSDTLENFCEIIKGCGQNMVHFSCPSHPKRFIMRFESRGVSVAGDKKLQMSLFAPGGFVGCGPEISGGSQATRWHWQLAGRRTHA